MWASSHGLGRAAGTVLAAVAVAALAGCGGEEPAPEGAASPEPGFGHVHGLGVNPTEDALYVATHYGLWRVTDGGSERIADRYQDTMGFTVAGPDRFLGSGHPDMRENLPAHLGLIESTDRGATWRSLSLQGAADFHALEAKHGQVYGYDSVSGTLMASRDGRKWRPLATVAATDFSVSPTQPRILLATTQAGLVRSQDGGRTFAAVADAPQLAFVDWTAGGLYGVDVSGTVWAGTRDGIAWRRRSDVGRPPSAMAVTSDGTVYVAAEDTVVKSSDQGRTFRTVVRSPVGAGD